MNKLIKKSEQRIEQGLFAKQILNIAVISDKPDTVSRKIFQILRREYRVLYATQNPQYVEEMHIDMSNRKALEGFLVYYSIDVIVICSSVFDEIDMNLDIEDYIVNLVNFCEINGIKPIMLWEKNRIVLGKTGSFKLVGDGDLYDRECNEIAEKILKNAEGLVIKCPITYGYDIKTSNMDLLEVLRHNRFLFKVSEAERAEPMLIDEVGATLSFSISMSGLIDLEERINFDVARKGEFSSVDDGARIVRKQKGCAFNLIYQLMPNDYFGNEKVAKTRISLGERLAACIPDDIRGKIDYIVPVPQTGLYYAMGLSKKLHVPYMQGLLKENTNERSFQLLDINVRKAFLKNKIFPIEEILNGKSIVLVDEAIFTGTTLKMVCRMLWEAGVKHIFLGIPTPPCYVSCSYYVQPKREMLLEYIREDMLTEYFDVDAVYFQTIEGFLQEVPDVKELCTECFTRR